MSDLPSHHAGYWNLIQSFHAMRHCPGLVKDGAAHEWLEAMWGWVNDINNPHIGDEGVKWVVIFLLNVWARPGSGGNAPWPVFDAIEALGAWDDEHRHAFTFWCLDPVRP